MKRKLKNYYRTPQKIHYKMMKYHDIDLITKQSKHDNKWRIFVPKYIREPMMEWYHVNLIQPSENRMDEIVRKFFNYPGTAKDKEEYVKNFNICQRIKTTNNPR